MEWQPIETCPMVAPFGKFKGKTLEDIPSGYLKWIVDKSEADDELIEAADAEYQWRSEHRKHFWE